MTITCDVADMQTTIEDEIPMTRGMMGQSLSYKTSPLGREEEEEREASVVLLSVKSVESRKDEAPEAEFEEDEKRIQFTEGKVPSFCSSTVFAHFVVEF